jgi:hypothetical protein
VSANGGAFERTGGGDRPPFDRPSLADRLPAGFKTESWPVSAGARLFASPAARRSADRDGPLLAATVHGRQWVLTAPYHLVAFLALPLVTLKVVGGIHYEAARLWLKGLRLQSRPRRTPRPGRDAQPDAITVPEISG